MCSFNIQYEKDKCFQNSTVSCSPRIFCCSRRIAKNVTLELKDGTTINIKKLKITRKKDKIIKCRIKSVAITGTTTTTALPSTTTPIPTTGASSCPYTDKNPDCANWKDPHCTSGKWVDWMMTNCAKTCKCPKVECPGSFIDAVGDVKGNGLGRFPVGSIAECSQRCLQEPACNSFNFSPTQSHCVMYKEKAPTAPKWRDFHFCVKNTTGTTTPTALPSTTSPIPTTGASSCSYTDKDPNCAKWKDPDCTSGKWVDWMMTNCAKTCKCTGSEGCSPLPDSWSRDCSKYLWACKDPKYPYFKEVCSTTCNYCDATTTTTAKPETKCECGVKKRATRIVGGSETEVNEYPWMVSLSMHCGGSVIANKWIVTAAHCFFDGPEQVYTNANINQVTVTVGEHDKSTSSETTLTKAVAANLVIPHPQYEHLTYVNDIALLRVPALDLKVYTPVCLPEAHATFEGKKAWVYGWGRLFAGGPVSSKLLELELTIVSDASAKQSYQKLAQPPYDKLTDAQLATMIFAGGDEGKDACSGDSGGPLTHEKNNGQHELVGATSWGDGCAKKGLPGAYAEVSAYISWFDEEIKKNGGANYSCNNFE